MFDLLRHFDTASHGRLNLFLSIDCFDHPCHVIKNFPVCMMSRLKPCDRIYETGYTIVQEKSKQCFQYCI